MAYPPNTQTAVAAPMQQFMGQRVNEYAPPPVADPVTNQPPTGTTYPQTQGPVETPGVPKPPSSSGPSGHPSGPGTFTPQQSPFAGLLEQMFDQHQTPSASPQWTPGMNPFAGSFQTANIQTPGNPLGQQTQSSLASWLANPSSFGTPEVQQAYKFLSGNIDDQFHQQETALEEDMARRGLADSSIRGGRLQDLNVGRRSAEESLGNNLLYQQALTGGQDRNAAISAAMGYGNTLFGQSMQQQGLQAGVNDQNFQQALSQAGFNQNANNQNFQNSLAAYGAGQAGQQQGFNQQQQLLQNMLGYNQQDYQNQLSTYNANEAQQQWYQQLLAALAMQGAS